MAVDYENDSRYIDIGDLPTGFSPYEFKQMYVRQFVVEELNLLHTAMRTRVRPYDQLIRAVQLTCSIPVRQLTDGDFEYLLAWLRKTSFPDFPVVAKYTCKNKVWLKPDNGIEFDLPPEECAKKGYVFGPCNGENTEIVKKTVLKVHMLDDDDLTIQDKDIDFPRVATLTDYYEYIEENPHMRYVGALARWVKAGKDFKAKLAFLMAQPNMDLLERIENIKTRYYHGITESMTLKCGQCGGTSPHEAQPRLLHFFASNSEQDIYNMYYNMIAHFGVAPDLKLPAKMFFYHHATFVQDRREAEQKAQAKANQTSVRRGLK